MIIINCYFFSEKKRIDQDFVFHTNKFSFKQICIANIQLRSGSFEVIKSYGEKQCFAFPETETRKVASKYGLVQSLEKFKLSTSAQPTSAKQWRTHGQRMNKFWHHTRKRRCHNANVGASADFHLVGSYRARGTPSSKEYVKGITCMTEQSYKILGEEKRFLFLVLEYDTQNDNGT